MIVMDWIFKIFSYFISLPLLEFMGITFLLIFILFEVGEYIGRKHRLKIKSDRTPVTSIVTATLGLLALLLAFTYNMAGTFFEIRRVLVINEASSLHESYLRADFLPEPDKSNAKKLLKEYVSFRYDVFTPEKISIHLAKTEKILNDLWKIAASAGNKDPTSVTAGLFIQSVNDSMAIHLKRMNYRLRIKIPEIIWLYLYIVTILSIGSLGYYFGLTNLHLTGVAFVLVLTFTVVIILISDLDRPEEGYFRVSQEPLIDLIEKFEKT